MALCLDTGHHAYRGGDPIAFFRRHHARIPYLHLKSVDRRKQEWVEREHIPFAIAVANDMFCEPSEGAVDFIAFRDALREFQYDGLATVEQGVPAAPAGLPAGPVVTTPAQPAPAVPQTPGTYVAGLSGRPSGTWLVLLPM